MQRAAQRADRAQRAKRLRRALVCAAAVPAVLITAACSSDSADGKAKSDSSAQQSTTGGGSKQPSASPSVQAAAYKTLPEACAVLSKKSLTDLVPKGAKSGKEGTTDDVATRASCHWTSLDNNGVKGSQFRWLNVSLLRFDSDPARGSGEQQAHAYYGQQVKDARTVDGAKGATSEPVSGTGDEATAVRYDLKKKEGTFKQQTVVARVENVVVTLDYNGAGLAGEKTPDAGDLTKAAEKAVKEVVESVKSANTQGTASSSPSKSSASPSKSASKSPAAKTSAKASAKASPSKSAGKKS